MATATKPRTTATRQSAKRARGPARSGLTSSRPRKATARDVIRFWFVEHGQKDWFSSSRAFDSKIKKRFAETRARAVAGELSAWRKTAEGRLAEILVLDQFSRQLFRGKAEAFRGDPVALVLAQEAVAAGADVDLPEQRRMFLYMPFMHSESLEVHKQAMKLFRALGNKDVLKFEVAHRDVIARFGRYPLRNAALGRKSTRAEIAYMKKRGDAAF